MYRSGVELGDDEVSRESLNGTGRMLAQAPTGSIPLADRLTKPISDQRVTTRESPGSR
jgi:hypothetical protein